MNTTRFFALLFGIFATGLLQAADSPKTTDRVQVIFDHPEKFTDVKDHYVPTDSGRDYILSQIKEFLVARGNRELPAGYTLSITFTDIDLAGDFEPWRGPQWEDVRIVKDIYPPDFKFTYTFTDSSGKVVKTGTEDIRDMAFDMRLTIDNQDPLHFEKDILSDWMRDKIRDVKKGVKACRIMLPLGLGCPSFAPSMKRKRVLVTFEIW